MVEKCETAWWSGVQAFYGLPNGVSSVFLRHLFPRVALQDRVITAKFSLLHRGSRPNKTIFLEALVCDRGFLLGVHRKGYSQWLKDWCDLAGFTVVFNEGDISFVRGRIQEARRQKQEVDWELLSSMSSTAFMAHIFGTPEAVYRVFLEASRFGRQWLRWQPLVLYQCHTVGCEFVRFVVNHLLFNIFFLVICSVLVWRCRCRCVLKGKTGVALRRYF